MSAGRNEPCPCGSGKKYKKCCLAKDAEQKSPAQAPEEMETIGMPPVDGNAMLRFQQLLGSEPFALGPDFQAEFTRATAEERSGTAGDFLGLPAAALYALRNPDMGNFEEYVQLNIQPENTGYIDTPVASAAVNLLWAIENEGGVTATAEGNLPEHVVTALHRRVLCLLFPEVSPAPESETESLHLLRIRNALEIAGALELRDNRFIVTNQGREFLTPAMEHKDASLLYERLLRIFLKEFNWRFFTYYSDAVDEIQINGMFNLYMLRKKAGTWINGNRLAEFFIRAFPAAVHQSIDERPAEIAAEDWDGELQIRDAFCGLFLETFCRYFGFVRARPAPGAEKRDVYESLELKTTELFAATFKWQV